MRRMVLSSLVLLPVMTAAQAGIAYASSASLRAELTRPTAPVSTPAALVPVVRPATAQEYAMMGDVPAIATPQLTRTVTVGLSDEELKPYPAVTSVVVSGTVDKFGYVRNAVVTHSAGELIDKRSLAAVSQYRFVPAAQDNRPADVPVSITITIKK